MRSARARSKRAPGAVRNCASSSRTEPSSSRLSITRSSAFGRSSTRRSAVESGWPGSPRAITNVGIPSPRSFAGSGRSLAAAPRSMRARSGALLARRLASIASCISSVNPGMGFARKAARIASRYASTPRAATSAAPARYRSACALRVSQAVGGTTSTIAEKWSGLRTAREASSPSPSTPARHRARGPSEPQSSSRSAASACHAPAASSRAAPSGRGRARRSAPPGRPAARGTAPMPVRSRTRSSS